MKWNKINPTTDKCRNTFTQEVLDQCNYPPINTRVLLAFDTVSSTLPEHKRGICIAYIEQIRSINPCKKTGKAKFTLDWNADNMCSEHLTNVIEYPKYWMPLEGVLPEHPDSCVAECRELYGDKSEEDEIAFDINSFIDDL